MVKEHGSGGICHAIAKQNGGSDEQETEEEKKSIISSELTVLHQTGSSFIHDDLHSGTNGHV